MLMIVNDDRGMKWLGWRHTYYVDNDVPLRDIQNEEWMKLLGTETMSQFIHKYTYYLLILGKEEDVLGGIFKCDFLGITP